MILRLHCSLGFLQPPHPLGQQDGDEKYRITPGLGAVAIYSPELHPCLDEKYPGIVFLQRRLLFVKAAGGMNDPPRGRHEATINGPVVQPERGKEPPARQMSAGDVMELGCATGKGFRKQEMVSHIPSPQLQPWGLSCSWAAWVFPAQRG